MSDTESIVSPNTVLADRYKLTEEIGRGGFGMVYRARQLNMDRDVAIKILPPKFMAIPDVVERFKREARLASRLRHPNTITVHDYGKHENLLFIVMEFLEGEDLADVLMRKATVPMDRILHIGRQVLKSLHEAHQHKIIHRDLKPENIFLTQVGGEEDYVKVLDFGIAKLAMPEVNAEGSKKFRKLTMSGSTVGTPTYMSPEQAAGEEVDALTDLYALGVILYEIACGRPPFKDDNPVKVMRAHLFEEVPRFPKGPLRDSRFEWIIRKALAKEKSERFESAREFLRALDAKPTEMLERADYDEEPPTIELPDVGLSDHELDSADIAFEQTASYDVEGSDVLSPRSAHQTDGMLAAQDSSAAESNESIPFEAIPESRQRDRVHQGAGGSNLTDTSALTDRSDLRELSPPPAGFESGASSSSIITVLEPGPDDEIILLTNKKAETPQPAQAIQQSAPPLQPNTPRSNEAVEAQETQVEPSTDDALAFDGGEPVEHVEPSWEEQAGSGGEWSWGEDERPAGGEVPLKATSLADELDFEEVGPSREGTSKLGLVLFLLLVAAAAAVAYLNYAGHIRLF